MKISKIAIASLSAIFLPIILLFNTASAISTPNLRTQSAAINNHALLASNSNGAKAQNNIIFYNENELPSDINCPPGGGSSIGGGINSAVGGSDEQQVYWCALRQVYDETHTAAIFGNILGEGAFNPVRWQYGTTYHPNDGGPFAVSWDTIYNSNALGVGVIQITSMLSDYLHYINQEAPDLLKYFQDPEKYSYAEGAMSKIGDEDFRRLVVLEINFINEKYVGSQMTTFTNITDLKEASYWWTRVVENCPCCGGSYANQSNGGCSSQLEPRASTSAQQLASMGSTKCSGAGSSTPSSSTSSSTTPSSSKTPSASSNASGGITWIGDSYSVGALNLIQEKFNNVDLGTKNSGNDASPYSYIQVGKHMDLQGGSGYGGGDSGMKILKSIVNAGKLRPYLVFALGTNDTGLDEAATTKILDEISSLVGSSTNVVLVGARTPENDYTASNKAKKAYADSHGNFFYADWPQVYDAKFFPSGNIHPNNEGGYETWANAISSALSGSGGGGSCSLSTVEIPSYNQCSGDLTTYPYNYAPGKTICNGGCGPSSMAMLVSVLTGQTVTPIDIVELTSPTGYYPNSDVGYELTQVVADKYNLEAQKITYSSKQDAYEKIKKYLNDGYVVHLSGEGSHPGFSNSNTGGHYIGLVSIDASDKVRVANSNSVGNNTTDLQNIVDAIHNGAFVILKNKDGSTCNGGSGSGSSGGTIDYCPGDGTGGDSSNDGGSTGSVGGNSATTECGKKVLDSTQKIIDIANQYGFNYSQNTHDLSGQFDEILKGKYFETDCTGFASFVMYAAFGVKKVFWTGYDPDGISNNPNYKEIPKDQVQVGDIFNYNYGCSAHGGIVTKIEDGKIVEIAQTGNSRGQHYLTSGTSSKNNRLGYSYYPNLDNGNLDCVNGRATDLKFYRYKECN